MTVVVTTVAGGDADVLDAQLAFHRVAGAAHAVVTTIEPSGEVEAVLARHAGSGSLHVTREPQSAHEAEWRTRMARFAATELGADWVVNLRAGEFWWPRAESLGDALVAIPPRYTIVQGLVRRFVGPPGEDAPWARQTIRESLLRPGIEPPPLERALRAVHRALPDVQVTADAQPIGRGHVPLRGWYPLEVLIFPPRAGGEGASTLINQAVEQGLADGSLTNDARLQHALETLRAGGRLDLRAPDVVDDATYAVECAAVGEVDTTRLIARLDELEARIAELEQGLRARVVRRLSRLAGGGRR
jgi:hypothetical protein